MHVRLQASKLVHRDSCHTLRFPHTRESAISETLRSPVKQCQKLSKYLAGSSDLESPTVQCFVMASPEKDPKDVSMAVIIVAACKFCDSFLSQLHEVKIRKYRHCRLQAATGSWQLASLH